ncbi:MAG: Na+/H+ antiporter subunit E [Lachnospiraceae bacterium]|nr:Na+/H+ antiporter subunit E [Lachnospiraceae bacterium]
MLLIFFLLWVIFNGQITLEIAIFGIIISILIYWFICKFMDWSPKKDLRIAKISGLLLQYAYVLLKEIFKANIATIKMIFTEKYEREPVLVSFETSIRSKALRVLLANSITITPGTITVSLEGNCYLVHCLDKDFSEGIENSVFVKLLEKMERAGEEHE